MHELEGDAERIWQERQSLIDDVRRIATELSALAEDAGVRFPAEPEMETAALPELPPLPEDASSAPQPDPEPPPPPPPPASE